MSIVVLKLPDVKRKRKERPKQCTYCKGETIQHWGQVQKPIKDVHIGQVQVFANGVATANARFGIIQKAVT